MYGTFILFVSENRYLNHLLLPCFVLKQTEKDFFQLQEIVNPQSKSYKTSSLLKYQKEIVDVTALYDEKNLSKVYNGKKLPVKKFIESIDESLLLKTIRPFIDSCIVKCLKIAIDNNIPIYISKNNNTNFFDDDKLLISESSPEITFFFEKNNEGLHYSQKLIEKGKELKLLGKSYTLLSKSPCRIIIDQKLYQFDDIDGAKLLPFFSKKQISVPVRMEQTYFETFIFQAITKYTVEAKGFIIEDVRDEPTFFFKIVKNLSGESCFFLSVKYADKLFESHRKTGFIVDLVYDGSEYVYRKIYRNFESENEFKVSLINMGLIPDVNGFYLIEKSQTIYQWISTNCSFFNKPNCEFNTENDQFIVTEIPEIKTEITTNNDWFDIKSFVTIGARKLPFIAFKKNILNGNREFNIDDSTVFIIPEEWFSRYVDVFVYGEQKNESISLKKHHFVALETLNNKGIQQLSNDLSTYSFDATVPISLKTELRPYQIQGYQWLCNLMQHGLGGCLADDMGLGKTLQTIALLLKTAENTVDIIAEKMPSNNSKQLSLFDEPIVTIRKRNTSIIVMPASLIHNWFNEFQKFAPSLHILKYTGNERVSSVQQFNEFDVILTTYGFARNSIEMLSLYHFHYIILDESQMIKNPYSKTYESLCKLQSTYKLVLTGTPIENKLIDLWSQMNFVNPGMMGNLKFFKETYVENVEKQNEYIIQNLKKTIKPFLLRRHKQEVLTELPEKQEQIVYCKMSAQQEKIYEQEKSKIRNEILDNITNGKSAKKMSVNILQAMLRLRQIANHPMLCNIECDDGSGKFDEIIRSLENIIDEGHKVLLFSSFVSYLDLFKSHFESSNIKYSYLTGESKNRESIVSAFQNDETIQIFLISIKAGGTGLNLTQADYVFIIDPWWNPAVEEQAISRSHRMGQENKVFVYRFITENTIEEKIQSLQFEKNKLALLIDNQETISMTNENVLYLLE